MMVVSIIMYFVMQLYRLRNYLYGCLRYLLYPHTHSHVCLQHECIYLLLRIIQHICFIWRENLLIIIPLAGGHHK